MLKMKKIIKEGCKKLYKVQEQFDDHARLLGKAGLDSKGLWVISGTLKATIAIIEEEVDEYFKKTKRRKRVKDE